jgi:transposase
MKSRIFIRKISEEEWEKIAGGLQSSKAFVMRRSQILLASERGESIKTIAEQLGCSLELPRVVINGFNEKGLDILKEKSKRPHQIERAYDEEQGEKLKELLRQSPWKYGKDSSLWTLEMLAEVSFEEGITESQVSYEAVRQALKRMGINWGRAKHWITSPDPHYQHKKNNRKA